MDAEEVAVTGANGFVGGAIVEALHRRGIATIAIVRAHRKLARADWSRRELAAWTERDLTDALRGAHHVVHAASVVHRPGAPVSEYEAFNVEGTRALVAACRSAGVRQIVLLSTIKVYGEEPSGLIDESTPIDLSPGYSSSKLEAERIVRDAAERSGIRATVLRLCPVFGRGDKGNVRRVVRAIARRRFAVPGDGSTRKSVVHVSTVAEAVAHVVRSDRSGTFVLADSVAPSMRELGDTVAAALGRSSPPSVPVPLVLGIAAAAELVARARGREPNVSRELIRKSLRSTVCSPVLFQRTFNFDCHVELRAAIEDEVAWMRIEGLL